MGGSRVVKRDGQAVEPALPHRLAVGDPALERPEARRDELATADATDLLAPHEPDAFEVLHVLQDGREREVERPREVGDRGGPLAEPFEDRPSRRFGDGDEQEIKGV